MIKIIKGLWNFIFWLANLTLIRLIKFYYMFFVCTKKKHDFQILGDFIPLKTPLFIYKIIIINFKISI